jgi:hypothetical protein
LEYFHDHVRIEQLLFEGVLDPASRSRPRYGSVVLMTVPLLPDVESDTTAAMVARELELVVALIGDG